MTTRRPALAHLLFTTSIFAMAAVPGYAMAQTAPDAAAAPAQEIVVTGSRIKMSPNETVAPVTIVDPQELQDNGYVEVGQALNVVTTNVPSYVNFVGNGSPTGNGQQYPNLFGLGGGRTLTLLDGIRMTSTSPTGLGDEVVNENLIPLGLLDRVDIVNAGGAAVYGSDAIAGVVNYVLKQNFQGVVLNTQAGESTHGDLPKAMTSLVAGTNFDHGKGNVAIDFEWNYTGDLLNTDRTWPLNTPRYLSNPNNTNGTLPATIAVPNSTFWSFNTNGVVFTSNSTTSIVNLLGYNSSTLSGYQFAPGGGVVAYNPGAQYAPPHACAFPFCIGGQGYPYYDLEALASSNDNLSTTAIAHYDITDHLTIHGQLLYGKSIGTDPLGTQAPSQTIAFTNANPFLTPSAIATLNGLSPAFASGGTLYLSRDFDGNLLPTREFDYPSYTIRGVVGADGDFDIGSRNFNYSVTYSRSDVSDKQISYGVDQAHLANAQNAVKNSAGQIVCAINATTVTDANCVPLNPFGFGSVTQAMENYLVYPNGSTSHNTADDLIATLGGDLIQLPAGLSKFSVSYEHRAETAGVAPSAAAQLGVFNTAGIPSVPSYGSYHTDEYAGELLVPVIGKNFTLPFIQKIDLNGQFRKVDNSLAGSENVWGFGGTMETAGGFTFRGSRSRNFRAPTLTELTAPITITQGGGDTDPCDNRVVNTGSVPATRYANCLALFTANPTYGLSSVVNLPAGSSAATRLANFEDTAYNCGNCVNVQSGGNPNLQNEIANNTTYGFSWSPTFVPGHLTFGVDRIEIFIANGLTNFSTSNFSQTCLDTSLSNPACATFTRDPVTGNIVTATSTYYNASAVTYRGDDFKFDYAFPLSWFSSSGTDLGNMDINMEATHNETLTQTVNGSTTWLAGTTGANGGMPWWTVLVQAHYTYGAFRLNYQLYYLPASKINRFDTPLSTATPSIPSNARHNISASYDFMGGKYQVRAGIVNLFDTAPSFPTYNYGDPYGRQFFVGFRAKF